MTHVAGSLIDTSVDEARSQRASDQSRLDQFSGTEDFTYIGIIKYPTDDFERFVDELEHHLAPPDGLFHHWLDIKKELQSDGVTEAVAHNEAFKLVNYEERYRKYLWYDDDARSSGREVARRVRGGENVALVCYCNGGKQCHRSPAREAIETWIDIMGDNI